ncbi:MAG: peptidase, partial [Planctomycetota bacterium]
PPVDEPPVDEPPVDEPPVDEPRQPSGEPKRGRWF